MIVRIKICCIGNESEAAMAIRYGASCLGLVGEMPSGPGPILDEEIARIRRTVPPGVATFLLTCRQSSSAIIDHLRITGCNTVQICDRLKQGSYDEIRGALPGISIVQVIHVTGPESLDEASAIAPYVDAILLDSGRPNDKIKQLGGTGRVHDWSISRRIRDAIEKPVFLAGGLNPSNVADAIQRVRPYAVDVCSGVRTNGMLDERKLADFVEAVRANSF